jgi:hypothetical protein
VTFAPDVKDMATAFSMPGGLLLMAWMVMFTIRLFQLGRLKKQLIQKVAVIFREALSKQNAGSKGTITFIHAIITFSTSSSLIGLDRRAILIAAEFFTFRNSNK